MPGFGRIYARWSPALLLALGIALAGGCQRAAEVRPDGPLRVAVSIIPQAWLVRAVGGPWVDVSTLVPPGESHHTYQPTDAQVSRVMASAIYFRIGTPFENAPWFQALKASQNPLVVDTRENVPLLDMVAHEHAEHEQAPHAGGCAHCSQDGKDPHIWLSPRRLKLQAAVIARTLGQLDPAHAAEYDRNRAQVERQLDELDQTLAQKLAPLKGKAFFVFHPAWGYLAADYGLQQVAVEVEGKEPSDRELTELQREARESGAKVVFVQPQFRGQAAQAVADAAGARLTVADPLPADLPAALLQLADALVASYH